MRFKIVLGLLATFALGYAIANFTHSAPMVAAAAPPPQAAGPKTPAQGYDVHVTAPHMVDGKASDHAYHHYCKVHAPDPQIVCLIYDTDDPNAKLAQVEWIYAKKIVRNEVSRATWNKNWHDHAVEIASGRVKVLDMPDDKAKGVADLVSTTDGLIYHFYWDKTVPNGKMSIAQAVGHTKMAEADWKNFEKK
jgi:hypothetical protein